jgi:MFS family permease
MQSVGAAWVVTSLTDSPAQIALLQTAGSLPLFLVGLLAGALADVMDRRRLLLITQTWMLLVAALIGVLTMMELINVWSLLLLTFLLGLGGALNGPAWQSMVPDLVGKEHLAQAIALNGAAFNLARAVGPALGGLLVAATGAGPVFLLNAASFLGVIVVIFRWQPQPREQTTPPEGLREAMQAGLRYTRYAPALQVVMIRTAAFIFAGSATWALLPVVARQELGLGAAGYGLLLGSIGIGAASSVVLLPRLRNRLGTDAQMVIATLIFATSTMALGYFRHLWLLNGAMALMGVAWMMLTSGLNVAAQTSAPDWVKARAVGMYLLVFQGGMAGGSALWGAVAARIGTTGALQVAAIALVAGLAIAWRWRLATTEDLDLSPSQHWEEPKVEMDLQPQDGPVLVTVEYTVAEADAEAFVQAMSDMQLLRRRDGAVNWGLFRDPCALERFVETFEVPTWGEHLRQHERVTVADREIEERALRFQRPGTQPRPSHLIAAQPVQVIEVEQTGD